jgi:hypothetical protein
LDLKHWPKQINKAKPKNTPSLRTPLFAKGEFTAVTGSGPNAAMTNRTKVKSKTGLMTKTKEGIVSCRKKGQLLPHILLQAVIPAQAGIQVTQEVIPANAVIRNLSDAERHPRKFLSGIQAEI